MSNLQIHHYAAIDRAKIKLKLEMERLSTENDYDVMFPESDIKALDEILEHIKLMEKEARVNKETMEHSAHWKKEAVEVLSRWDNVFESANIVPKLGVRKSDQVFVEIKTLQEEVIALRKNAGLRRQNRIFHRK